MPRVVSLVFVILGAVSFGRLPVAQYPEIAPPVINVTGQYPGASAEVVAATVVTPLEQQINGVENMLYISSNATGDGRFTIAVTFELGTNLDIAQVQVQNRVAIAQPRLPSDVRNIGVTVAKASPDLMMVVHLYSPDKSRDTLFISNYANIRVIDVLEPHQRRRLDHRVRRPRLFDARLARPRSPAVARAHGGRCRRRLAGAERAGRLGRAQPAARRPAARLPGGRADAGPARRSRPVRRHPGQADRRRRGAPEGRGAGSSWRPSTTPPTPISTAIPPSALGIFQLPGSNALATAKAVQTTMDELAKDFPAGLKYTIVYNPTEFIQQSVDAVVETILEAVVLVVLVVILFLQTWRAAVIPIVAIPVSLIGTFFFMAMFGFSLNNLSLFGLVLAIGIVVDDAIVVVENVERNIAAGLSPRDAARQAAWTRSARR